MDGIVRKRAVPSRERVPVILLQLGDMVAECAVHIQLVFDNPQPGGAPYNFGAPKA